MNSVKERDKMGEAQSIDEHIRRLDVRANFVIKMKEEHKTNENIYLDDLRGAINERDAAANGVREAIHEICATEGYSLGDLADLYALSIIEGSYSEAREAVKKYLKRIEQTVGEVKEEEMFLFYESRENDTMEDIQIGRISPSITDASGSGDAQSWTSDNLRMKIEYNEESQGERNLRFAVGTNGQLTGYFEEGECIEVCDETAVTEVERNAYPEYNIIIDLKNAAKAARDRKDKRLLIIGQAAVERFLGKLSNESDVYERSVGELAAKITKYKKDFRLRPTG